MQNRSHAVMAQRIEAADSPDDFPTPPWATRALMQQVFTNALDFRSETCLEPACGAGHMASTLMEYFGHVQCSDAYDYGYGQLRDFLAAPYETASFDWIITNPPFRRGEEFIREALRVARKGVAVIARTVFLESAGRYNRLFKIDPPSIVAQFCERVPMLKGRLDAE